MKTCSRCRGVLPLGEFYSDSRSRDGVRSQCKGCHNGAIKARRTPEMRRIESAKRRAADPSAIAAYQRDWNARNPEKRRMRNKRFRDANPEKARAQNTLNKAVARGRVERPCRCEVCGGSGRIEAHHEDYSRPYDVQWLCRPCHVGVHRRLRSLLEADR